MSLRTWVKETVHGVEICRLLAKENVPDVAVSKEGNDTLLWHEKSNDYLFPWKQFFLLPTPLEKVTLFIEWCTHTHTHAHAHIYTLASLLSWLAVLEFMVWLSEGVTWLLTVDQDCLTRLPESPTVAAHGWDWLIFRASGGPSLQALDWVRFIA